RRGAPRQHRRNRRHGRARARAWRQPGRDRARAVLWLGAEEPRRTDAEPRAGRACHGGGGARVAELAGSADPGPTSTPPCEPAQASALEFKYITSSMTVADAQGMLDIL